MKSDIVRENDVHTLNYAWVQTNKKGSSVKLTIINQSNNNILKEGQKAYIDEYEERFEQNERKQINFREFLKKNISLTEDLSLKLVEIQPIVYFIGPPAIIENVFREQLPACIGVQCKWFYKCIRFFKYYQFYVEYVKIHKLLNELILRLNEYEDEDEDEYDDEVSLNKNIFS